MTRRVLEMVLWLGTAASTAHAGVLLGMTNGGQLFSVNESTGAGIPLCMVSGSATEFEIDPSTGRGFFQHPNGAFTGQGFDVATCADAGPIVTDDHSFTGLEWIGQMLYGATIDGGGGAAPSTLRILDPITGASTVVGPTGVNSPLSGLTYDPATQTLFGIAGGPGPANFFTIDRSSGAATVVGSTGIQAGSLELGASGRLFAGGSGGNTGMIYEINRTNGTPTLVGDSGLGDAITGLAFRSVCGDSQLDPGEQCDTGAGTTSDCCSATCRFEGGQPCDDGDVCTASDTCAADAATCTPGAPIVLTAAAAAISAGGSAGTSACAGDPGKGKIVLGALAQVSKALGKAATATKEKKRAKQVAKAKRFAGKADKKLPKAQGKASPACGAALASAVATAKAHVVCF